MADMSEEELIELICYGDGTATSKGHGRKNPSTADIKKNIDPSTYAGCERVRKSCRRQWERSKSLVFFPNTHVTLTYNTSQRPEMKAFDGAVHEKTWKKYMEEKKALMDRFYKQHEWCDGLYRTELCTSRALHLHIAVHVTDNHPTNWEDYFRRLWKETTGCFGDKMVKVTYHPEEDRRKLLSYLYTQEKTKLCAPLCAGYTKGHRTIAGFANDPLCYVPQKVLLPKSIVQSICHTQEKYYRKKAASRKLKTNEEEHLNGLISHFGVRHGFQGSEMEIINKLLEEGGYPPIELKIDFSSNINFSKKETYVYSPE